MYTNKNQEKVKSTFIVAISDECEELILRSFFSASVNRSLKFEISFSVLKLVSLCFRRSSSLDSVSFFSSTSNSRHFALHRSVSLSFRDLKSAISSSCQINGSQSQKKSKLGSFSGAGGLNPGLEAAVLSVVASPTKGHAS